jgi:hypothetical protein
VIGDPATADLCAAIGLGAFAGLGVTASFEPNQFPPGCIVDLMKGGKAEASISMYGTRDPPNTSDPTRTESGLTVYVARFDPSYGDCERDIATDGLTFKIQAVGTSTTVRRAIDCGGTNAMTKSLAAAVAAKRVPRIALASPSVTLLNMCAVVRASKLSSLPVLAGAKLTGQAFGIDCEVTAPRAALFFNTIFDSGARPQHTNLVTIGGHRMFANRANRASLCSFISVQGTTSDGRHEEISAASNADDNKHPPAAMCTQTSRALSMVLDTAGLH